jgi:retinol dehydrogenase 12
MEYGSAVNGPLEQTMPDPICLITGATDGVGKATAAELAARGFTVVLAARNAAKAEAVRAELAAAGARKVDILLADLASLQAVRGLAATFAARYPRLDVLINNAGVMIPARLITEDGFEATHQINYLAPFLLTQLLLDKLLLSEQGRIINLTSNVYSLGKFDPDNLQGERRYSAIKAYANSKLFMLLFTIELARRLTETRVTVNAVHPGVVRTQMLATAQGLFKLIAWLATPFASAPETGARTSVHLAASREAATMTAQYFAGGKPTAIKSKFNTAAIRHRLWEISAASLQSHGLLEI